MPKAPSDLKSFTSLVEIIESLRGPEGCEWDKDQTHESLTKYAIEEVFEFIEAVESKDKNSMKDELGDILLQVVLHSEIARQNKDFDIYDVIQVLSEKMVRRHPHVFTDKKAKDKDEIIQKWQEIKDEEKKLKGTENTERFDVPLELPSLQRSEKIGKKTKNYNFDWETPEQVLDKVDEELAEVKEAMQENNKEDIQSEIGDLLFSVAQLARHHSIDPEKALRQANRRFEKRFFTMKSMVEADGSQLTDFTNENLEKAWQKAKQKLK